jgi:hypothetical protein
MPVLYLARRLAVANLFTPVAAREVLIWIKLEAAAAAAPAKLAPQVGFEDRYNDSGQITGSTQRLAAGFGVVHFALGWHFAAK